MCFFKNQCALNISWYEDESQPQSIRTYVPDPSTKDKKPLVNKGICSSSYDEQKIHLCIQNAEALM